nr:hypothetical protein Iba_chr07dCG7340 [Ipomoea batatas]
MGRPCSRSVIQIGSRGIWRRRRSCRREPPRGARGGGRAVWRSGSRGRSLTGDAKGGGVELAGQACRGLLAKTRGSWSRCGIDFCRSSCWLRGCWSRWLRACWLREARPSATARGVILNRVDLCRSATKA